MTQAQLTSLVTVILGLVLGAVFVAACVYMALSEYRKARAIAPKSDHYPVPKYWAKFREEDGGFDEGVDLMCGCGREYGHE